MFCDEIDIYNLDINQFELIYEDTMTLRPLYQKGIIFDNHLHIYYM